MPWRITTNSSWPDYYGCKIGFENDRGEVIAYAKRFRKLHKLQEEFDERMKDKLGGKYLPGNNDPDTINAKD